MRVTLLASRKVEAKDTKNSMKTEKIEVTRKISAHFILPKLFSDSVRTKRIFIIASSSFRPI
jgi:hypothetical protein